VNKEVICYLHLNFTHKTSLNYLDIKNFSASLHKNVCSLQNINFQYTFTCWSV